MPKSHSKSGRRLQPTAQPSGQPWAILTGSFPFWILLLPQTPFHRLLLESKTGRSSSLSQPSGKRSEHRDEGKKTTQPLAQGGSNQNFSPHQALLPLPWLGWDIEGGRGNQSPWMRRSLPLHSCFEGSTFTHQILTLFCRLTPWGPQGGVGGERNVDSFGLVM